MDDRISDLSNVMLSQILAYLPSEEAFSTCILSKGWERVFREVPTLDFNESRYTYDRYTPFANFVYGVLMRRIYAGSDTLERFSLVCSVIPYEYDLHQWLSAAVECKVREVELEHIGDVPSFIFCSHTLVTLKVIDVDFPQMSVVDLPSIRKIYLERVRFQNCHRLMQLLSGCPNLEDLSITSIDFNTYTQNADWHVLPKLESVTDLSNNMHIPLELYTNVKFMHIEKWDVEIPRFPNITHLVLEGRITWNYALQLITRCPELQCLVLRLDSYHQVWEEPCYVPLSFRCLQAWSFEGLFEHVCELGFEKYLMGNSPYLLSVNICLQRAWYGEDELEEVINIREDLDACPKYSRRCKLSYI